MKTKNRHPKFPDPWLDRWLPLIKSRAAGSPVLEIGCGYGDDTVSLLNAGLQVMGFDLSFEAVAATRARAPSARIEQRDLRDSLPEEAINLGVILASLSLHYFAWEDTVSIVARIRLTLRSGGILLCRLNSTEDKNFGAGEGDEIESNYFLVKNKSKRFFDESSVQQLFADDWNVLSLEHITTDKYKKPKTAWEIVLERAL